MGKLSPSLRSVISSSTNSLLKKPPSPRATTNPNPNQSKPRQTPKPQIPQNPNFQNPKRPSLFKTPDLKQAKTLLNSLISNSATPKPIDHRLINSFLQSYTTVSTSLKDSIALLRHAADSFPSFAAERSTFHSFISQSCRLGDNSVAGIHSVLNLMVSERVHPNPATIDVVVRSLCSVGKQDDAVELVKEICSKHCKPDDFSYNFLVKCLCKTRDLSSVYGFIDDMKKSFSVMPNLVTYTILIDNVCNSKNLREATRLLSVLRECGFKPDCYVYNTIMKGYCMLSKGSEAIGVYKKMKEEGVEPDLVTYNTLIFGLSKSGRVSEAKKYLQVMVESGHFPDAVTYTSLMNGMCREGDELGALELLNEMESKGCSPNACTYNTLLHGLCKGRLLVKAVQLYEVMKKADMKLDTASYATFVRTLCREGRVAEAYEVFDYAMESGSLTEVAAYLTLESTLKWLKKAKEQGLAV